MECSIVIPLCNEEENLPLLYERLTKILSGEYEIIFVDDGSSDGTLAGIKALHQKDARVKAISFSRNFGSHVALQAGLDYASGQIVVQMVGDLQDQPEDIPRFLEKIKEGYEIVYAVDRARTDPFFKKLSSRLFYALGKNLFGTDFAIKSAFIAMRRNVVEAVRSLKEVDRHYMSLVDWIGFKRAPLEVERAARFKGKTKYNFSKSFRLAMQTIFEFSDLPFSLFRLCFFFALFAPALILTLFMLWQWFDLNPLQLIMPVAALMWGIIFFTLAVLCGYVGRVHRQVQGRPLYIVREKVGI
jgi:dolichol-phosphate mannosyltransferase